MATQHNALSIVQYAFYFYRMSEVDDNLNYMLGQLSLVVSEFNQVLLILVKKKQNRLKLQLLGQNWFGRSYGRNW